MTDKEMKVERYREENKTSQKGQTVFTGSSLMEMFPINKLLNEHGDDTIIYNRGIGGFISDELLAVIDVCATDLMPSKVFINIGTNDLSWSTVPISQLMNNYDKIISAIEKAVPEIYLISTQHTLLCSMQNATIFARSSCVVFLPLVILISPLALLRSLNSL